MVGHGGEIMAYKQVNWGEKQACFEINLELLELWWKQITVIRRIFEKFASEKLKWKYKKKVISENAQNRSKTAHYLL